MQQTTERGPMEAMRLEIVELREQVKNLSALVHDATYGQRAVRNGGVSRTMMHRLVGLTTKQHVVMQMIMAGCSNKDIAAHLGVQENTVKSHVRAVMDKLEMKSRSRAKLATDMLVTLGKMDPEDYLEASGGLPILWYKTMRLQKPDPCAALYM